ncbi:putative amino acid permease-associated region [Pseudomonas fluorescens]|uniref:Putative amino acid permease-associated region n=1 Tax=Pseudomonas fluorescens TaxID=294 RepID=A0A0N8NUV5_PSEFL|nr:putative amino acid permease-associated region [Pseudomonas fluorescens]
MISPSSRAGSLPQGTVVVWMIPHAGGPFAYSRRAFGEKGGLIAGLATLIEFVFAPPAIALAIGA